MLFSYPCLFIKRWYFQGAKVQLCKSAGGQSSLRSHCYDLPCTQSPGPHRELPVSRPIPAGCAYPGFSVAPERTESIKSHYCHRRTSLKLKGIYNPILFLLGPWIKCTINVPTYCILESTVGRAGPNSQRDFLPQFIGFAGTVIYLNK